MVFFKFDLYLRFFIMAQHPTHSILRGTNQLDFHNIPVNKLPALPQKPYFHFISSDMKWFLSLVIAVSLEYWFCQSDITVLACIFAVATFVIFLGPKSRLYPEILHDMSRYPGPRNWYLEHKSDPAQYIEKMKRSLPPEAKVISNRTLRMRMPWNKHLHDKYRFVFQVEIDSKRIEGPLIKFNQEKMLNTIICPITCKKDDGYIVYMKILSGDRDVIPYVMNHLRNILN